MLGDYRRFCFLCAEDVPEITSSQVDPLPPMLSYPQVFHIPAMLVDAHRNILMNHGLSECVVSAHFIQCPLC